MVEKSLILKQIGINAYNYISKYVNLEDELNTTILKTRDEFNIDVLENESKHNLINIAKLNDVADLNVFFSTVNKKLINNGTFIGFFESNEERKRRLFKKYPPIFNLLYFVLDHLFKSTFLNFYITRKLNYYITAGRNKIIPKAELLGRLVFCGFEIIEDVEIDNIKYVVCKKVKSPTPIQERPRYGFLFKMKRVGFHGDVISVYKIRTMYRYAEYIQDYVYQQNDLQHGGKIKDDYRITWWGKLLRSFWIDELPMIYNLIKGDLKLVGVRPISKHYMSLYSEDLQELRKNFKPGLIPPFYADMPGTLPEIMESETRYLNLYKNTPYKTDLKYLGLALKNIVIRSARSN